MAIDSYVNNELAKKANINGILQDITVGGDLLFSSNQISRPDYAIYNLPLI